MQISVQEAETQLSGLIEKALDGEEIIIADNGKPLVTLQPIPTRKKWVGCDDGKHFNDDRFNEPLDEDFLAYFTGDKGDELFT